MIDSGYYGLLAGYSTALLGWMVIQRMTPGLWPKQDRIPFAHPWHEVGWALIAVLGIVAIGQLYQQGIRLASDGALGPVFEAINQTVIFSPLFVLLYARHQSLRTAWIFTDRLAPRLAAGLGLALLAILVYTTVRKGSDSWFHVVLRVYHPRNLPHLVQVLLEDMAIAILFIRFRAAIGGKAAVVLVAALFAAGHIPALLSGGAPLSELMSLFLDTGIAIAVLAVVQRSSDVLWFWCVHFAMDMMQFYAVP